jgi:hypothetical protein
MVMNVEIKTSIESRFISQERVENVCFIKDEEGQKLGFGNSCLGNKVVITEDSKGILVSIEYLADGTKIYHMEKDSKGLPAMHEFRPDGSEVIYLFNAKQQLEKMVDIKESGDKVTHWFSPDGKQIISQEQRLKGGIVFKASDCTSEATVWLKNDGETICSGSETLIQHLQEVFAKFLDGMKIL